MFEGNWNWVWHNLFMIWSLCVIWRSFLITNMISYVLPRLVSCLNMKPRQFWKLSNLKDVVFIHQSDHSQIFKIHFYQIKTFDLSYYIKVVYFKKYFYTWLNNSYFIESTFSLNWNIWNYYLKDCYEIYETQISRQYDFRNRFVVKRNYLALLNLNLLN